MNVMGVAPADSGLDVEVSGSGLRGGVRRI